MAEKPQIFRLRSRDTTGLRHTQKDVVLVVSDYHSVINKNIFRPPANPSQYEFWHPLKANFGFS
jgi:hypothetical protein